MDERAEFDVQDATRRLQEAVRTRDEGALRMLVSEKFQFVSGRSLGRMDRDRFIAVALAAEWRDFDMSDFRVLGLGDVTVADFVLEQDASFQGQRLPHRWVVSDVWAREHTGWRLVARHPEPVGE